MSPSDNLSIDNVQRLQRAIRAIQLVQRNNAPSSVVGKACATALRPLMAAYTSLLAALPHAPKPGDTPERELLGWTPDKLPEGGAP